jgi:hypothetical protein
MQYTVLVRIDAAGECPVLVRDGEELLTSEGVRWRLVGDTDDYGKAIAPMQTEHGRCTASAQSLSCRRLVSRKHHCPESRSDRTLLAARSGGCS